MIFTIGTTAEAIKLIPLWRLMAGEDLEFNIVSLGQHPSELRKLIDKNRLAHVFFPLDQSRVQNLESLFDAAKWFFISIFRLLKRLDKYNKSSDVVCIHGDTLSSLVGSIVAKLKRFRIVHIEAGLRSESIFQPFPEELTRRCTAKLVDFHFCPSEDQFRNLLNENVDETKICVTNGNTALDNLISANAKTIPTDRDYGLVTLHRSELLQNSKVLKETLFGLSKLGLSHEILLVADHRAKLFIERNLGSAKLNMTILDKVEHDLFLELLLGAKWVITDSGGLQQECSYLGVPTLIHRKTTESFEGLGENIQLSHFEIEKIEIFVENFKMYRIPPKVLNQSPSGIILDKLTDWGLVR
jgi:UDP-N-acetylglucosamine 2-epimerase (non-hydrolysing)